MNVNLLSGTIATRDKRQVRKKSAPVALRRGVFHIRDERKNNLMDRLEQTKQNLEKAVEEFLFAAREAGVSNETILREVKMVVAESIASLPA